MSLERIDARLEKEMDFYSTNAIQKSKDEIASLEKMKKEVDTYRGGDASFKQDLDNKIRSKKAALEFYSPPLVNRKKDSLIKEKQAIEEKLKEVTLTEDEEWTNDPYKKRLAHQKCMTRMSSQYEGMARRLRRINRTLEPDNEMYNTLDYLKRREK